jgi:hypothetical protein
LIDAWIGDVGRDDEGGGGDWRKGEDEEQELEEEERRRARRPKVGRKMLSTEKGKTCLTLLLSGMWLLLVVVAVAVAIVEGKGRKGWKRLTGLGNERNRRLTGENAERNVSCGGGEVWWKGRNILVGLDWGLWWWESESTLPTSSSAASSFTSLSSNCWLLKFCANSSSLLCSSKPQTPLPDSILIIVR